MVAEEKEITFSMHLSTETKIIGGIALLSLVLLIGGVFLFSSQGAEEKSIPQDQIVASSGLHWHPKLEVYVKGVRQEIPANLGIAGNIHHEMHTHTEDARDGVIHMEMSGVVTKDETKLSNFFKIWGKEFSKNQIFDKVNGKEGKVKMIVNGQDNYEFESYLMKDKDNIEIRYE